MKCILRRALSLAPLVALRNFTQRRMAKNGQLIMLRHYMKNGYIKAKAVSEGIKAKDAYDLTSSGKGCSKRCKEDYTKEKEHLEARLREEMDSKFAKVVDKLAKVVEKLEEKFAQKLQSMGMPQQSNIDLATTDGTSRDEDDNSNNNIEVESNLEGDSKED